MGYDGSLKFDTKLDTAGFAKGISEITGISEKGYETVTRSFLGISAGIAGIAGAAVKTTADFDAQMSKVSAISGATGKDFDDLRDKAREMGAKTKFSATESAEAMEYMAMAGWKTGDMLGGIEGIMNLAAASGENLGTTSDIVTDALTAFGLSAEDSGHFADVLAAASSNANTNVSMLGESFKYVAPVAGSLGMSAEDTSVALGLMANSGIKASQAGTTLRSILTRMARPTKQSQEALDALGLSLTDEQGNVKDLATLMGDMREAFSHCTDAEKAQYAALLAGQEGMSGLLAIVNASEADYNKLTGAIENCDGSAEEMALTMQDNLQGQLTILKSALEELAISIGDTLAPTIRKIVGVIQGWVDKFNSLDEGTKETIVKIGLFVAAVGPVLLIIAKVVTIVTTLIGVISSVAGAIGTVVAALGMIKSFAGLVTVITTLAGGPLGLIAIAIGAVAAAFVYLWNTSEGFRNFWINLWNTIKTKTGQAIEGVKGFISSAADFIKAIPEKVTTFFTETLPQWWTGTAWPAITSALQAAGQWLSELPGKVLGFFNGIITQLGTWAASAGAWITENVPLIIESIVTFFSELPYKIGYAIGFAIGTLIQWGADIGAWIAENVPLIIESIVTFFSELPGKIWDFLTTTYQNFVQWGSETLESAREAASEIIEAICEFFQELPGRVGDFLSETWDNLVQWGSDMLDTAQQAASDIFSAIYDTLSELPSQMADIGANIVTGVWNGICDQFNWFYNSVSDFFGGIVDGAKDALDIGSPSKVFRKQVGRWIPPGAAEGIKDAMPGLKKTANNEMRGLVESMQATVDVEASKLTFEKAGEQEYERARAERMNTHNVNVSGTLEGDRPIVVETELTIDKRRFAKEITPAVNHEMYRIDKQENDRGKGN